MEYKEAWFKITEAKKILISSHVKPDCDALGSSLALGFVLKKMGKKCCIFNDTTPLPKRCDFLNGFFQIKNKIVHKNYDLIILTDCGNFNRSNLDEDFRDKFIINIDHHPTNDFFGNINLVDFNKSSTASIVYELLLENNVKIVPQIATCIYAAIMEDTEFLTSGNIDLELFSQILSLVENGANPKEIATNLIKRKGLCTIRLKEICYKKFKLLKNGKIALIFITNKEMLKTGATHDDVVSVIKELQTLACVEVAVVLCEEKSGVMKASIRSKTLLDVGTIANHFGGGGHKYAAGFEIAFNDEKIIINKLLSLIKERM